MDPLEGEVEELKNRLPKAPYLNNNIAQLINYQGFWLNEGILLQTLKFQRNFQARDTDLLITGLPKTGTTWLKALVFAITTRIQYPIADSPLLKTHPHELVFNLEYDVYGNAFEYPAPQHLDDLPSPRFFSSHLSYTLLPDSIKESKCRVLYICRNPLDTILSLFYFSASFFKKLAQNGAENDVQPPCFEDIFEEFCQGRYINGPFFEHVIGYWKMSLERPDKVLFQKYEELKDKPSYHVKRVADLVGVPFSPQEENEGVVEQIIKLCSIGNLKELEVNKNGVINKFYEKSTYFRKGEVGDWRNHFTPVMVDRILKLMDEKFQGTGLSFKLVP